MRYIAILFLLFAAPAMAEESTSPSSTPYSIGPNSTASYQAFARMFLLLPNTIDGTTGKVTGSIGVEGAVNGTVAIDAASFDSGIGKRDEHIREILQTGKYPTIEFAVTLVEPVTPGDVASYAGSKTVRGNLTVRGVTKEVSIPVTVKAEGESFIIDGAVEVKYTDFGIEPPTFAGIVKRAHDRIILKAHLVAVPVK